MIFRSKFLDRVPFENFNRRILEQRARMAAQQVKTVFERAEDKLQERLVPIDRLMYRGGNDKIFDTQTRVLFNGIVRIDNGDKFERILRIKDGSEAASLVRVKGGKNYQAEIIRKDKVKKFDTGLSAEEIAEQTEKMLKADEAFYRQMMENFKKRKIFTINKK